MKTTYYKKSGIVIMNIARDLFSMKVGVQIPTILSYTEKFQVSRGIVQNALSVLEEDGCIALEKRGVKGTFLVEADFARLYQYTNFGSITGTMPLPLNREFASLATALCEQMGEAPFPFSFAYMSGSEKRLEMMREQIYDFMLVSMSTAEEYLRCYDFLESCMILRNCIYSPPFAMYFFDKNKSSLEDGMRVGIDRTSMDQIRITHRLCQGKNVEMVDFPVVSFEDLIDTGKLDCVVYRALEDSGNEKFSHVNRCAIPDTGDLFLDKTRIPVVLVHRENYGIGKLLSKYMTPSGAGKIQAEVLEGKRAARFY